MKIRSYKATAGYHDLMPGMSEFGFSVKTTDEGKVVFKPNTMFPPDFNEIQVSGDKSLRQEYLPDQSDANKILFMDDPNYEALKLRLSTLATKQIPLEHSSCFVSMWLCLSNSTQEIIESGQTPPLDCYVTGSGNWGGIKLLKNKKSILPHIKELDSDSKTQLNNAKSSKEFASKFIKWRDTLSKRMTYQPSEDK